MSNIFYRNPRLVALVVGLILVSGLSSYVVLPRMEDPIMTKRAAIINTFVPGAEASRVESLVTDKIEDELSEIEEIKEVQSTSRPGVSTITVELRDDVYEVDSVWSRVRDKINDVQPLLPPDASEPQFEETDVKAYALIVALHYTSEEADTSEESLLTQYAILRREAEVLKDRLESISGTERVDTFGDPDEEIIAEVDPARIAALGLTSRDISNQIASSDAKVTAGQMRSNRLDLPLEVDSELDSLNRVARTPIRSQADGSSVELRDFASVRKGIRRPVSNLVLVDGHPAVALGVLVRPNQRVDHWAEDAREELDEFEQVQGAAITVAPVFEQVTYVKDRLDTLQNNLFLGAAAVLVVILFMMGWRSALIVGTALPLSAFMVLSGLRWLEIPVHQMSITGLIIALGLLIDNAIVMVDEVSHRIREGRTPGNAVADSVSHMAIPLSGSTVTTALAFAPIAIMPGPAGEFVGSIAISVILAVFSSLFLALTVIPALSAFGRLARSATAKLNESGTASTSEHGHWWQSGIQSDRLTNSYRRMLSWILKYPSTGILFGVALPIIGFIVATQLPEQFFPPADRDQLQIEVELSSAASLEGTLSVVEDLSELLEDESRVTDVTWFLGESAPSFYYNLIRQRRASSNYAQALVQLDSGENSVELIRDLQNKVNSRYPSSRVLVRQLEQGPPFNAPVEVRLYGPDLDILREVGDELRQVLSETSTITHTRSGLGETLPKVGLQVDEHASQIASLSHADIATQLNDTLEGAVGGSILEETEELPVRVQVSGARRGDLDAIASLQLQSPRAVDSGDDPQIPLSAVARLNLKPEIGTIPHRDGVRVNEVKAYTTAGVLPAEAVTEFKTRLAESDFVMPEGYTMEFGGESEKRDDAIGNLMSNVGVLLVLMVATLVLSFNSFRLATVIGSVATLSVGLGLLSLWAFGYPFGFMAIVGTMGLIGVAINDGIVVLAALRDSPEARAGDPSAMTEVVIRSTRHVVATSLTTIAGFLPLVVAGGGFWPPLAVAISGGVGGATVLALIYVPSVYRIFERRRMRSEARKKERAATVSLGRSGTHTLQLQDIS